MANPFERRPELPEDDSKQSVEDNEEIRLRFPEMYQSAEWKKLDELDRAQLLLVAEGVKPGTIIEGNYTGFPEVVKKMGLEMRPEGAQNELNPTYQVASPEVMSQYHRAQVSQPENAPAGSYDRLRGRFLGYPTCCIDEYLKPTKNRDEILSHLGKEASDETSNFEYELGQLIQNGKQYPEELDYLAPTFTPCSAACSNALPVLHTWKQVLEKADPEAAEVLKKFNWQDEPYRSAHQEEMDSEAEAKKVEDRNKFIRRSAGLKE